MHWDVSHRTIHNSQTMESASVPINWWTDKENVAYIHNRVLFSHKEEWNYVIYRKIDITGDHHVKRNNPDGESQISHVLPHMQILVLKNEWQNVNRYCLGAGTSRRREGEERRSEYGRSILHTCMKTEQWNLLNLFQERGRRNRWYGFDWCTLYTYMETSQWNPFIQQIYTSTKWKK
jgi:hypothetical protein